MAIVAAGKFLAAVIGSNTDLKSYEEFFSTNFELSYAGLLRFGEDANFNGSLHSSDDKSNAIVISYSNLIAIDRNEEALLLAGEFVSEMEFYKAIGEYCCNNISEKYFRRIVDKYTKPTS